MARYEATKAGQSPGNDDEVNTSLLFSTGRLGRSENEARISCTFEKKALFCSLKLEHGEIIY